MFNALILGLIQGLSEFLPISSSGHVTVAEFILGVKDEPGFAAAIHLATAFAAIYYFRKDIWEILKGLWNFKVESDAKKLGLNIIYATIPAAIFGLVVTKLGIDEYFSSPMAIGISAIVFGAILFFAEKYNNSQIDRNASNLSWINAVIIGSSQIIAAIFPGASRSGVTLSTSFFLKFEKNFSAKFIFLISIPITLLASLNEIVLKQTVNLNLNFLLAFIAAFVSGIIAIKFLLYFINESRLKWIVLYRFIFGLVAIYLAFV